MTSSKIAKGFVAGAASLITMTVYAAGGAGGEIEKVDPNVHFHPKGKPPSEHTLKVLQDARDSMPFDDYTINLITPDNGEKFAVELSNATFTNVEGFLHDDPDLSITINRSDLENIMMGVKSFAASIEDGTAQAEGNVDILGEIARTLVTFEMGFEILPGTAGPAGDVDLNPYEVSDNSVQLSGE